MKRLLGLIIILALCVGTAHGLNVMVISDGGLKAPDGTVLIADPEEGRNKYNDSSLVSFLQDLGYEVDTRGMAQTYRSASKNNWTEGGDYGLHNGVDLAANDWWSGNDWRLQAVQDADLVIVSRFTSSGTYNRGRDIQNWNELSVPLICQSGHLARSGKLGWTNENNAKQDATATDMEIIADHPFVDPFTSPVKLFDWSTGQAQSQVQNAMGDYPLGAILIGTYDGSPMLADIPAGTDFDAHSGTEDKYSVAGARRVYMGHWGYDASGDYSWDMDLSDEYKAIFAEVVAQTIPEPATIALLGLGGLALLRRKR